MGPVSAELDTMITNITDRLDIYIDLNLISVINHISNNEEWLKTWEETKMSDDIDSKFEDNNKALTVINDN